MKDAYRNLTLNFTPLRGCMKRISAKYFGITATLAWFFIAPSVVISSLTSAAYKALNLLANLFKETCYFVAPLRLFSIFMR